MANAQVSTAVNLDSFKQAVQAALIVTEGRKEYTWHRAITRANDKMLSPVARWYFDGETLKLHSANHESAVWYTVTAQTCECEAFRQGFPCWHRAAHRLLVRAAEIERTRTARAEAAARWAASQLDSTRFATLTAEMDELFA